jgi:ATP-dependent Lhr-like helicase
VDLYGRRHFLELVSVFTSDPVFKVMHGQKELGSVDQLTFARHTEEEPAVLSMGGRSWSVVSLDWRRREAFVVPAEGRGKSRWQGGKIGMSYKFSRAVHSLLVSDHVSDHWTGRACDMFASVRAEYGFLVPDTDVVVGDSEVRDVRWYTFAGGLVNTALADMLKSNGFNDVSASDFCIRIEGSTDALRVIEMIKSADVETIYSGFTIGDDFIENLKFSECLPLHLAHELIRERLLRIEDLAEVMTRDVSAVYM